MFYFVFSFFVSYVYFHSIYIAFLTQFIILKEMNIFDLLLLLSNIWKGRCFFFVRVWNFYYSYFCPFSGKVIFIFFKYLFLPVGHLIYFFIYKNLMWPRGKVWNLWLIFVPYFNRFDIQYPCSDKLLFNKLNIWIILRRYIIIGSTTIVYNR